MKKKLLTLILFFCCFFSLNCYEWGGLFTETFKSSSQKFEADKINFRQSNSLSLWFKVPFSNDAKTSFLTQATFKYNFDFNRTNKFFFPILDFDLMQFSSLLQFSRNSLLINAGRFYCSDYTKVIFSQKCDGISIINTFSYCETVLFAGYTGFLNSINDIMIEKNKIGFYPENGDFYVFAHKYIPVSFTLKFPSAFLNQQLLFEADAFFDLTEEKFNRFYATLSTEGPVADLFFYSIFVTFGFENFAKVTNFNALKFNFLLNENILINLNCSYASGNQLFFSPFTGFTSNTAYNSFHRSEYTAMLLPAFDINFSHNNFYSNFSAKAVFDFPNTDLIFKGIDIFGSIIFNVFSDLQIGLTGFCFLDMLISQQENNYAVSLNCSFSF